jgi:copper homeostasis protein
MPILLEVIVTSTQEAVEAEQGGADRLELVTRLELGGLTPLVSLVEQVCSSVSIPVRVMLRENPSMAVASESELKRLCAAAGRLASFPIDGLVTGFLHNKELDRRTMNEILAVAPHVRVTFHRAFDDLENATSTIEELKQFSQIDRILTNGGPGSAIERLNRVNQWQGKAGPQITMLFAMGLDSATLPELANYPDIREIHTGRAVREPQKTFGMVSACRVAALKQQLNTLTGA